MRSLSLAAPLSSLLLLSCAQQTEKAAGPDAATPSTVETTLPKLAAPEPSAPYPARPLWGDTHVHTSRSYDAFAFGTARTTEDAIRFARGQAVTLDNGFEVQLSRPLDFLAIADHAEGYGLMEAVEAGAPALVADPQVAAWSATMQEGLAGRETAGRAIIDSYNPTHPTYGTTPAILNDFSVLTPLVADSWQGHLATMEAAYDPGTFTTLMGYEFTPTPDGDNLHRVVLFRDGPERVGRTIPFPSVVNEDPEALWAQLAAYEDQTGGQALAIPHNANQSRGRMFALSDFSGAPIDADYAALRAHWEPLVEATQIKGDSESHPDLSPNDPFAEFGDDGWDEWNLFIGLREERADRGGSYVREALKRGLALEAEVGVNPFKLGMIGSTDAHVGASGVEETAFVGKTGEYMPAPSRAALPMPVGYVPTDRKAWQYLSSGYAAVWARENTREAIFDAMRRREAYATTGPRMTVRVFGGWDFAEDDLGSDGGASSGYARGVPMGGDLTAGPDGGAPTLLLSARMDPEGARLDRVQVVKGWLGADGQTRERVYDALASDGRITGPDGTVPTLPGGADPDALTPQPGGAPELSGVWTDPDFDAGRPAFYYVRVLEVETPRWTAYDRARFGGERAAGDPEVTRERAYSSPVWYTPG